MPNARTAAIVIMILIVMTMAAISSCSRAKPDFHQEATQIKTAMELAAGSGTLRIHVTNIDSRGQSDDLTMELQCPGRMHLVNHGATQGGLEEEVLSDGAWYVKVAGRGWWHPAAYRSNTAITCTDLAAVWASRLLVPPYGSYEARDSGPGQVNTQPCRRWTLSKHIPFAAPDVIKDVDLCIDADHQILRFAQGKDQTEFYDYGAPIQIKPPESWMER